MAAASWVLPAVLIAALASPATAQSEQTIGGWTVETIKDPITDKPRVAATLMGEGGLLALQCDAPGRDSVYIHWVAEEYFGGDFARRRMTIRFDQDPPIDDRWAYDGTSAAQTWDRQAMSFARRLTSANQVALRGTDFRGGPHTAVWAIDPSDARLVVEQVFRTCEAGSL